MWSLALFAHAAFAAYPREQAQAPPMGWNSWNCYGGTVTAERVLAQARAIADSGLRDKGYVYVVIDDGWQGERGGELDALQSNAAFPDIGELSAQVRALGLRLGIYSTPWETSYAGHVGSAEHEAEDAWQWAAWGIRYLKYDWKPVDPANATRMRDALACTGAPVVFSLSNSVPQHLAPTWAQISNLWRTSGDINDSWDSLESIAFRQSGWEDYAGPGHWNDPDMMVLGYVGWGDEQHPTNLTADEQRTHMTMWALLAAPLILGADLSRLDDDTLALLSNDDVLEVDQDPAGVQASRVEGPGVGSATIELWSRPLSTGATALGVFNRGDASEDVAVAWSSLGLDASQPIVDLWTGEDVETDDDGFTVTVPPHGAAFLRLGVPTPVAPAFVGPLWERGAPGEELGYTVLTTGSRPITLSAERLPDGFTLEGNFIHGTPTAASTNTVTLTATGPGGTSTEVLTLEVAEPSPILLFSASELSLPPGQEGALRWVTTGASSVSLDPGGAVDASGTWTIAPESTTTYTLSADGVSAQITVEVPSTEVSLGLTSPGRLRPTNDATAWQGWGTASEDWSAEDETELTVGGVSALRGLATHAPAELVYPLGGHYERLLASVGIDDEVASAGASAVFVVRGDGEVLWQSDVLSAGDAPVALDVDLSGVLELVLTVEDGGDSMDNDHADWLDPVLIRAPEPDDSGEAADSGETAETGEGDKAEGCGCGGGSASALLAFVPLGALGRARLRRAQASARRPDSR